MITIPKQLFAIATSYRLSAIGYFQESIERKIPVEQPFGRPDESQQVGPSKPQETYAHFMKEMRGDRYLDLSKDTQFSDAWLMLGFILTIIGIALSNHFFTASALMLFIIAAISRFWNDFSLFGLHYRREFSETRAFLGETIELTLEVRNQKFLPLSWLQIVDIFPATLPVEGEAVILNTANNSGEFRSFWMPGPFQKLRRSFTLHCTQRGYHHFGPATLSTGDGFGLFDRKASSPEEDQIIVYPKLYTMTDLHLPAKNPFGEQTARRYLFEDPLRTVGIRDWQPADRPQRIHWKATVRHQQLLSRIYEPSEEPQILIFLNIATMARYWQGVMPDLLERSISVAASLAAVCTEQRLPVGLVANGVLPGSDQPIRLLPGRSHDQLVRILELLAAIQHLAAGHLEKLILAESPRLPWGATLVVVSAIVTAELMAVLLTLDAAGRQIVLFTLAEAPPTPLQQQTKILVYHLPHLVDDLGDLRVPQEVPR